MLPPTRVDRVASRRCKQIALDVQYSLPPFWGNPYRPQLMKQLTGRRPRLVSRQRRRAALTVVSCSILVAACRTGGPMARSDALPGGSPVVSAWTGSGTASTVQDPSGQIISAWLAAEQAFESAARAPDPSEPDLTATTIAPQLESTELLLARMQAAHEIARGPVSFGTPAVVAGSIRQATVRVCARDAEIVVSSRTKAPIAGIDGEVEDERFSSIMEQTDSGWKLASQTVGVGACDPS